MSDLYHVVEVRIPKEWTEADAQAAIEKQRGVYGYLPRFIWQEALAAIEPSQHPKLDEAQLLAARRSLFEAKLKELCVANGYAMPSLTAIDAQLHRQRRRKQLAEQNYQQAQLEQNKDK